MMTLKELTTRINESEYKEQLNNFEVTFELPYENLKEDFKGVISIYRYFKRQYKGWGDICENLPSIFEPSKKLSEIVLDNIEKLVVNNRDQYYFKRDLDELNELIIYGIVERHSYNSKRIHKTFTFESSETVFLLQLSKDFPNSIYGAVQFLRRPESLNLESINTDTFLGYLQAYEFRLPDEKRTQRRDAEDITINKLKADLSKTIDQGKTDLHEIFETTLKSKQDQYEAWYANSTETFGEFLKKGKEDYQKWVDDSKEKQETVSKASEKTKLTWLNSSQQEFEKFKKEASQKIEDLEATYKDKLQLEAPIAHWEQRAKRLKKEGHKWLICLIVSIVLGAIALGYVLNLISNDTLENLFDTTGSAIRWSIVFITFVSFLAYGIRTFAKLMFSAYHLYRDAQERRQLTYVYLALKKDKDIEDTERQLIMQSIFSRADSGLLKDDSSPTMPGGIISKMMKGE